MKIYKIEFKEHALFGNNCIDFKVNKKEEPVFLIQYKRREKPRNWNDYGEEIK